MRRTHDPAIHLDSKQLVGAIIAAAYVQAFVTDRLGWLLRGEAGQAETHDHCVGRSKAGVIA
ncbi:MAG TPA: hypothetical protein VLI39_20015 [Sedimentisphaerales bacterium]|nr:hypothetical protein [Sedimentisphaerales bacterium]